MDGNVSWVGEREGERGCFEVSASWRGQRRAARWGRIGRKMDLLMPHMIDTAPFRGVCQAPSHAQVARELVVPMSFFGYGKAKLPEVVQVGHSQNCSFLLNGWRECLFCAQMLATFSKMAENTRFDCAEWGCIRTVKVLEETT